MYGDYGGLKKQLNKMDTLPINLIVFATTMGHQGDHGNPAGDTYQTVISNLFSQVDPSIFQNKVMHLKVRSEEEDKAREIKNFCTSEDIRVIESHEDIVHHFEDNVSHAAGYFKDIYKTYSDTEIRKTKYSLWLEDDWLLRLNKIKLEDTLAESINFLDNNPDQLCVKYNLPDDSVWDFRKAKGNHFAERGNIFTQAKDYTEYGPAFHFQPNINRTSEIFLAWKTLQQHLHRLGSYHCELMATHLLREGFSNSETPFSFFDPEKIYSQHIG